MRREMMNHNMDMTNEKITPVRLHLELKDAYLSDYQKGY